jgi:hypothetical protein
MGLFFAVGDQTPNSQTFPEPLVGAVEPQRGRDGGVSGNLFTDHAAAFATSLKLDSSHIRFAQPEWLR